MKNFYFKQIFSVIFCFLLLFTLGCEKLNNTKHNKNNSENVIYELQNYILIKESDNWYIELKDNNTATNNVGSCLVGYLSFPDLESMKTAILTDNFTKSDCAIIDGFEKENGKVFVPNLDSKLMPKLPDGYSIKEVQWSGKIITFVVQKETTDTIYLAVYYDDIVYKKMFDHLLIENLEKLKDCSTEKSDNRTIITGKTDTALLKCVKYEDDDVSILEIYTLDNYRSMNLFISESIPSSVYVFRNDAGNNVFVSISVHSRNITIEELKQFNILCNNS